MPPASQPDTERPFLALTGPLERYRALRNKGEIQPDHAQDLAAVRLENLWRALAEYRPEGARGWRARLPWARPADPPPKGLYLYGAVGRGKSMLMDLFFELAPVEHKRRVHFYAFMQEVHARIHARREQKGDPIPPVARAIAAQATLLCFDEFQVTDIADAMILGRLFSAMIAAGVVVVATSNRAPDELYKDGLQRERFLPFIALLKERLDVFELAGRRDYRLARFTGRQTYFVPADAAAHRALEAAFADLTDGAAGAAETLSVQGRSLEVPRAAKGVAWFSFEELFMRPIGPADYLALCANYHTFILEDIPRLGPEMRNEAKRFNTFIDTLYEAHGNLLASAAARAEDLYTAGDGAFEFKRTASRLIEMQSDDYIAARKD